MLLTQPNPAHCNLGHTHTSGNCSLIKVTSNNPYQANPQAWFLCMPICAADWSRLSHIPLSVCTPQWMLQLSSAQPNPLSIPNLRQWVVLSSQACRMLWFSCSLVEVVACPRSVHNFPTRPTSSIGSSIFQVVLQSSFCLQPQHLPADAVTNPSCFVLTLAHTPANSLVSQTLALLLSQLTHRFATALPSLVYSKSQLSCSPVETVAQQGTHAAPLSCPTPSPMCAFACYHPVWHDLCYLFASGCCNLPLPGLPSLPTHVGGYYSLT